MDPIPEAKPPVQVEQKPSTLSQLTTKGVEAIKKVLPEKTRTLLLNATQMLQRGKGRKALEILIEPVTTLEAGEKKDTLLSDNLPVEKSDINLRYQKLQSRISEIKEKTNSIIKVKKSIFDIVKIKSSIEKQQLTILEEIKQSLIEIRKEHIAFINEALQDKQLLSEVREAYIEDFITPEIDRSMDETKKQDFLKTLRASFDMESLPEDQQKLLEQKMDKFLGYDGGFYDLSNEVKQNFLGDGKFILRQILNDQAANNFKDFEESLNLEGNQSIKQSQVHQMTQEIMDLAEVDERHSYINESQIKKLDIERRAKSTVFIKWLKSMKKSQSLATDYGELLNEIDNKIYQTALDKSLSDTDGGYIDSLVYYPTPDAIRNLVVIAAADQSGNRTFRSNGSLINLAKRSDWPQILDEVEKKYPTLKKTRTILEHWNFNDNYYNQPDIREAANDFTFGIFTEEGNNPRLTVIASEALANSSMFNVLVNRGLITDTEVKLIESAQEKTHIMERDQNLRDQDIQICDYDLSGEIQNSCRPLMEKQSKGLQIETNINRLKHLAILSQEIIDCQDPKIINILSSDSIVNLVSGCRLSGEKTTLFIRALTKFTSEGITSLNPLSDLILGEGVFQAGDKDNYAIKLISGAMSKQINEMIDHLSPENPTLKINDENWQSLLSSYIIIQTNNQDGTEYFSKQAEKLIPALFQNDEAKDFCLNKLNGLWHDYLTNGTPGIVPLSLSMVPELISFCHGAGPLSQIESLGLMIKAVNQADIQQTTAERTKGELFTGLRQIEDRFIKEKWSNEDKSDFYNISRDILNTSPSIFSDFLNLFQNLNPSEIRRFTKDLYPLYRAKLALIEQTDKSTGIKTFTKEQLMALRTDIRSFSDSLKKTDKSFEVQKTKLLEEIRSVFQERFGITKIPEDFTSENSRSFINITMYLANLHDRKPEKENVLGFYLALKINNRWDDFRKGAEINPAEYLTTEKSETIRTFLSNRQILNPLKPETLGITQEELPEFYRLLQQESQSITVGNIETIDVKLNNVIINLRGLEDLDLYPEPLDKQRMKLLIDFGNKKVGSVVARIYQQLNDSKKQFQFSEEELQIKNQIETIITENNLQLNSETIKKQFQDGLKPLATVINLLSFTQDTQAEQEVSSLRQLLQPKPEIIDVFNRLGEDFKSGSGALALSQDLSYLDNLVVKREDEIKPGEKILLAEYIGSIRQQMIKLQTIYDQVKNKFTAMEQGYTNISNDQLKDKMGQISQIINAQTTQQTITSTVTNDLNVIIENIRECLSCVREGSNNDTNLTFGDVNKFYLYSQTEAGKKGSLSDEVVFVEPITHKDGKQEITFVLDKVYGTNTPTILINQIGAVLKKYQSIKQKFPNIKLSVFVSGSAISSSGLSTDLLIQNLREKNILAQAEENVEVNLAESAAGDHYAEFGGSPRTFGERTVNGVTIR